MVQSQITFQIFPAAKSSVPRKFPRNRVPLLPHSLMTNNNPSALSRGNNFSLGSPDTIPPKKKFEKKNKLTNRVCGPVTTPYVQANY